MSDTLEELYLERLSFIEERCRDTPEYNAASDEYDAARAAAYLHAEAGLRAEAAFGAASMNALDMARGVRL